MRKFKCIKESDNDPEFELNEIYKGDFDSRGDVMLLDDMSEMVIVRKDYFEEVL